MARTDGNINKMNWKDAYAIGDRYNETIVRSLLGTMEKRIYMFIRSFSRILKI